MKENAESDRLHAERRCKRGATPSGPAQCFATSCKVGARLLKRALDWHLPVAVGISAAASLSALAQDAGSRTYLEVGLGAVRAEGTFEAQVARFAEQTSAFRFAGASYERRDRLSPGVVAGWQFHPNVGVEAGYVSWATLRSKVALFMPVTAATFSGDGYARRSAVTAALAGRLPPVSDIQLGARAGVAAVHERYTRLAFEAERPLPGEMNYRPQWQWRPFWALTASYALTPRYSLVLEYANVEGVGRDFAMSSIADGPYSGRFAYRTLGLALRCQF